MFDDELEPRIGAHERAIVRSARSPWTEAAPVTDDDFAFEQDVVGPGAALSAVGFLRASQLRDAVRTALVALLDRLGVAADRISALVAVVDVDTFAIDRPDVGPPTPTSPLRALATASPNGPPAGLVRESALGGRALL